MACKCIDKIRDKLKAHHKSEVDLELKMFVSMPDMDMGADIPPLYYRYRDGKKWKKSYVHFTFCPFCGKKK